MGPSKDVGPSEGRRSSQDGWPPENVGPSENGWGASRSPLSRTGAPSYQAPATKAGPAQPATRTMPSKASAKVETGLGSSIVGYSFYAHDNRQ